MAHLSIAAPLQPQDTWGTEFTGCCSSKTPTASTLLTATHAFQVHIMVIAGASYLPPSKKAAVWQQIQYPGKQPGMFHFENKRTKQQGNWLLCILAMQGSLPCTYSSPTDQHLGVWKHSLDKHR